MQARLRIAECSLSRGKDTQCRAQNNSCQRFFEQETARARLPCSRVARADALEGEAEVVADAAVEDDQHHRREDERDA